MVDETQVAGNIARTFNTAKKYAEEILFPKMDMFQRYQRQACFGDENLDNAILLDVELREVQRFNGLKAMNEILHSLLLNISSTVRINRKKGQITMLNNMMELTENLQKEFEDNKEDFFTIDYVNGKNIEKINRTYFNKVKALVERMYINCEILMTKNKLLFSESRDEVMDDKEILKQIKEEYTEN